MIFIEFKLEGENYWDGDYCAVPHEGECIRLNKERFVVLEVWYDFESPPGYVEVNLRKLA